MTTLPCHDNLIASIYFQLFFKLVFQCDYWFALNWTNQREKSVLNFTYCIWYSAQFLIVSLLKIIELISSFKGQKRKWPKQKGEKCLGHRSCPLCEKRSLSQCLLDSPRTTLLCMNRETCSASTKNLHNFHLFFKACLVSDPYKKSIWF